MAVVLSNAQLTVTVRAHPAARDAHGMPVPAAGPPEQRGPYPGAVTPPQGPTSNVWSLRVDPRCWPIREDDTITDNQGRTFSVRPDPRLITVPGHPDVDYISVSADLDPPQVP